MPIQCVVVHARHSANVDSDLSENYTGSDQTRLAKSRTAQTRPNIPYPGAVPVSGLEPPTY